jgi:hypothetical protein
VNQFVKNVTAFVDALGYEEPAVILTLSQVPWDSDDDRNDFINFLTREVE